MTFRLTPNNLCMSDAMPFQQHFEARVVGRDLNDVLTDELLMNVRSNIKPGDAITVCGYADQTRNRLTQFVNLRVYRSDDKGVKFIRVGDIVDIPPEEDDPKPKRREPQLKVVRGYQCFNVMDAKKDAVLESFKTKVEAESWMAAHGG